MSTNASRADLDAFRSSLANATGLRFDDDKLPLLAEVFTSRMAQTRSKTSAAYLDLIAATPEEVAELARTLTVSETYFFRDRDQFRAAESLIRARESTSSRHLSLLSAGCSSGEEAYSLAILIRETLRSLEGWTVSILGVDLNPEAIQKARSACYRRWSLRETPDVIRQEYFQEDSACYALKASVTEMVRFEPHNLVRPTGGSWGAETFDVAFCRNVLMYFTPTAAREVVARIARSLSPGGYLFLGHAENLRGLSHDFHLRQSHGTFYYERRSSLASAPEVVTREPVPRSFEPTAVLSDDTSWFQAITRASGRIEKLSRACERRDEQTAAGGSRELLLAAPRAGDASHDFSSAMHLMRQERFQDALRLLVSAPLAAGAEPDVLLLRAMLLVSTGELAPAEELCMQLLAIDELNAGAHYVMAICREHVGDRAGAVQHSQAAAYLDSEFAMPHLQLGRLARRSGEMATARRELGLALDLLPREDAARIVLFGGGFNREALVQICRGELMACKGDQ